MSDFVIVYGGPRTGTSLTCDLVRLCGYSFGKTETKKDARRGRNEHMITSYPFLDPRKPKVKRAIEEEGINAAKVIGFPEWIDFIEARGFNVKLLLTQRDKGTRNKSANSMLLHLPKGKKVPAQEKDIAKRENWLRGHPDANFMNVHFEKLLEKDESHLRQIVKFIRPEAGADYINTITKCMKQIIDPDIVRFK